LGSVTFDVHTLLYAASAIVIGFQAVNFSLFTKIFAISEGLLPTDERLNRLFKCVTLETGLVSGTLLVVIGLCMSLYAVSDWGAHSFGDLKPDEVLRIVIPSITALILGCEVILSSFFFSVLGLKRK
jgi:hypothetical protein